MPPSQDFNLFHQKAQDREQKAINTYFTLKINQKLILYGYDGNVANLMVNCYYELKNGITFVCFDYLLFCVKNMRYFVLPLIFGLSALSTQNLHASLSLEQASERLLTYSPAVSASLALHQADVLEAQSLQKLHHPSVSVNLHAFSLHQNSSVPLDNLKAQTEQHLNAQFGQRFGNEPTHLLGSLHTSAHQAIANLPSHQDVKIRHHGITPSITAVMPLYTGGVIDSTKNIAALQAQRGEFGLQEQVSLAKLSLIRHYFNVQLQKQLVHSQQKALDAMQLHVNNAHKLEQQGFISKGQRMQFEVARNQTERLYQNAQNQHQNSVYELNALLGLPSLDAPNADVLTTPLFINTHQRPDWQELLDASAQSALGQKLDTDVQLAEQNIALRQAAKKPKVAAVANYTLDKQPDWFVGVAVQYQLYSGIDRDKQIQAAHLQKQAAQSASSQVKQHISTTMHTAYGEMTLAQNTHTLLAQNRSAAQENLRIQTLAFKEGFGTVAGVVDAQTALSQIDSETAINAYRYILALATLLHHAGAIDDFYRYLALADTHRL